MIKIVQSLLIKKKVTIILLLLSAISLGGLAYFSLKQFNGIPEKIRLVMGLNYNGDNIWDTVTKNGYKQVVCKKDLLNPEVVILIQFEGNSNVFGFYSRLHRNNIFSDFYTTPADTNDATQFFENDINKISFDYNLKGCDYYKKNGTVDNYNLIYNSDLFRGINEMRKQEKIDAEIKRRMEEWEKKTDLEKIKAIEDQNIQLKDALSKNVLVDGVPMNEKQKEGYIKIIKNNEDAIDRYYKTHPEDKEK